MEHLFIFPLLNGILSVNYLVCKPLIAYASVEFVLTSIHSNRNFADVNVCLLFILFQTE